MAELTGYAGRKVPVKGAVPWVMEFAAESSKTVLTKFCPRPPRSENSGICVPFGRDQDRGERRNPTWTPMLSETVMSSIWSVPPELTVTVEVERAGPGEVAAGIDWSTAVGGEGLRAGDRAESGP